MLRMQALFYCQKQTITNWSRHKRCDIPTNKKSSERVSLTEVNVVADHTIYSKLLEVLTLHDDAVVRSLINLSIRNSHTACAFIAVIGK